MGSVKPIQITFRHLPHFDELAALVERRAEELVAQRAPIISVRAALERPHRRHRKGSPVRVSLELGVPERTIVARARHEDARAAIHEAFDIAERALRAHHERRRRGKPRSRERGRPLRGAWRAQAAVT